MNENEVMTNEVTTENSTNETSDKGSLALGITMMAFACYGVYSAGKWVVGKGKKILSKRSQKDEVEEDTEITEEK